MGYTPPYNQSGQQVGLLTYPGPVSADGFSYGSAAHYLVLPVNPDIQITPILRTTATQTIGGVYIDNFGVGVANLTMSSHTGWQVGAGSYQRQPIDGKGAFDHLWVDIIFYYFDCLNTQTAVWPPQTTLQFFNNIDGQFLSLVPTGQPQRVRNHAKPYLYQYNVTFIVAYDLNHSTATNPVPTPLDPLIQLTGPTAPTGGTGGSTPPGGTPTTIHRVTVQATPPLDTVWGLCAQFVSGNAAIAQLVQATVALNHLGNPNFVIPGETLSIPVPS